MKGLRLAHRLNHLGKGQEYPVSKGILVVLVCVCGDIFCRCQVKRVSLGNTKKGFFAEGRGSRILSRCKEVSFWFLCPRPTRECCVVSQILGRTMELFHREYWRRTPLLLVILFSLAFTYVTSTLHSHCVTQRSHNGHMTFLPRQDLRCYHVVSNICC